MEQIILKTLPQIDQNAQSDKMDDDWVSNFFDECRLTTDEEMQALWSRILAKEANAPGRFSKRTINLMASLDGEDAILFKTLCGFTWKLLSDIQPIIYDSKGEIYTKDGSNCTALQHLDAIGLICFLETGASYNLSGIAKQYTADYQNTQYLLIFDKDKENVFGTGKTRFTTIGSELATICSSKKVEAFEEYIIQEWTKEGIKVSPIVGSSEK